MSSIVAEVKSELSVDNWLPEVIFIDPDMLLWSACRFDRDKKAWEDEICDVTEDN